jgi:hypothetical protein
MGFKFTIVLSAVLLASVSAFGSDDCRGDRLSLRETKMDRAEMRDGARTKKRITIDPELLNRLRKLLTEFGSRANEGEPKKTSSG